MRTTTIILLALVLSSTVASAQPAVQIQLTEEQREVLGGGEISTGAWITGSILAHVVGFGVGQAVQGRWRERGWIMTFGEAASATIAAYAYIECCGGAHRAEYAVIAGVVGLVGFRIWGIVDATVVPPLRNAKIRRLREGAVEPQVGLFLSPPQSAASGGVAGLSLTF